MKKLFLAIIITGLFLSYVNLAYADAQPVYSGVEQQLTDYLCTPSGNPANGDLYNCINRLYRFALVIASSIAVLYIVVAGYIYMSAGGNQESVDKAKSIIESSITALVILFAGFVLLKALNPDLVKFQNIQPPSVVGYSLNTYNIDPGLKGVPSKDGVCDEIPINLCQGKTLSGCGANACSSYSTAIQNAAGKVNVSGVKMANLLRSIMYKESGCNPNAQSSKGACGIMQMLPETAAKFKSQCGASSQNITCQWLKDNPKESICMAAYYFQDLSGSCGNSVRNLAAGYNGGAGACGKSITCSGTNSCSNEALKKWECMYNGPTGSKDECNTGYTETRNYATQVLFCYLKQ